MTGPLDRVRERLEARGSTVRQRDPQHFMATCPAHDDHEPSLSISAGNDGRALLNCHAGCPVEDVIGALDLRMPDLFATNGTSKPSARDEPRARVAVYPYEDAQGEIKARKVRFEPKSFMWEVPDGGGWRAARGSEGNPNVLYRHREVIEAETIHLCEGEKAADRLAAVLPPGATATCAPCGWHERFADFFAGREVVVWADRDDAGKKKAREAVRDLGGVAKRARVVQSATTGSGHDAFDHLEAGFSIAEAHAVAGGSGVRLVRMIDVTPKPITWLWRPWIPLGKVTVIDGDPGLGKSTLVLDLAARLSRGARMPDGAPGMDGGVVLLSAEDDDADTIRPRCDAAGASLERIVRIAGIPMDDGERMPAIPDDIRLIEQAARIVEARLLVIDPLMAFLPPEVNSHRDQDVRRALAPLAEMAARLDLAVVVLRHLNKGLPHGGSPMYRGGGSIGIIGAARAGLMVSPDPDDPRTRVVVRSKANLAPDADACGIRFQVVTADNESAAIEWLGADTRTAAELFGAAGEEPDEVTGWLRAALEEGPVLSAEVQRRAKEAGFSKARLQRAQDRLGVKPKKEGFKGPWSLALPGFD